MLSRQFQLEGEHSFQCTNLIIYSFKMVPAGIRTSFTVQSFNYLSLAIMMLMHSLIGLYIEYINCVFSTLLLPCIVDTKPSNNKPFN